MRLSKRAHSFLSLTLLSKLIVFLFVLLPFSHLSRIDRAVSIYSSIGNMLRKALQMGELVVVSYSIYARIDCIHRLKIHLIKEADQTRMTRLRDWLQNVTITLRATTTEKKDHDSLQKKIICENLDDGPQARGTYYVFQPAG